MNFFAAKNLKKQVPPRRKEDSHEGITIWDSDGSVRYLDEKENERYFGRNDFPQQLTQVVYSSPVASACLELWCEFLIGQGFENEELNEISINDNENFFGLHKKIAYDLAYLEGVSTHITYNGQGLIDSYNHVPFEQTRLGFISKNGKVESIKTNPYFGIPQDFENKKTKTYYPYSDNDVIAEVYAHNSSGKKYEYPGRIYWKSIEKPLARIYPSPSYCSGVEWMKIDAEIQKFHYRNVTNNMLQSHIVNIFGDADERIGEDDDDGDSGKSLYRLVDEEFSKGSGSDNGGHRFYNFIKNPEEKMTIEPFPTNANDQLFQTLQDLTTRNIAVACKVPPILVGISQQGKLGESKEILNAIKLFQSRLREKQDFLANAYYEMTRQHPILSNYSDFSIKNTNLVDILPDWAIDVLSEEEKRDYLRKNFNVNLDEPNPEPLTPNEL